jgi:acetyl-CoA carboxylase biotin carboxyl carrier protein
MGIKEEKYVELIRKVAQVMDECDLGSVNVSEQTGASHISFSLQKNGAYGGGYMPVPMPMPAAAASGIESPASAPETAPAVSEPGVSATAVDVKSPMVGVFYTSPSPEAEVFVRIGDTVKKGDVLCILEAMKLMNEVQAEMDGRITDICAANGDVVEFGQVLFKIEAG